jgi:tetratricopeptide (TPR) repeat protein
MTYRNINFQKKRSYYYVASLFLFLLIFSCGKPQKDYILKVKINKLQGDQIFDKDLVYDVVFDANEFGLDSVQRIAHEIFLQGLDQFKNKKNTAKAIQLFKESLLYFPDGKTYFELGNALLEYKTNTILLKQAESCFDIALELQFKPVYATHIKSAQASALLVKLENEEGNYHWWEVRNKIWAALEAGYFDTLAIQNEPAFADYVKTNSYKELVIDKMAKMSSGKGLSKFDIFKNSFTNYNPNFKIGESEVSMESYKQSISYEFADFIPEMENVSFGREVSNDFYYVAKVAETPEYVALVYASSSFMGEGYQPVETILAIYDANGKQISRKLISCQCSVERIKTCSFDAGNLVIEEKKRIWEKPLSEVGIDENKVKSCDLIAKASFNIDNNGQIKAVDVPVNFNDSVRIVKN